MQKLKIILPRRPCEDALIEILTPDIKLTRKIPTESELKEVKNYLDVIIPRLKL